TDADLATITETLTRIGLEVEEVDDRAVYAPFVIAKVLSADKHPDADRLKVLAVDMGGEAPVQVVCGAPNAREGLVGVFAPPGAYVPGIDTTLQVGKIRGVESRGMMLSERELELSDEHDGIIDLTTDAAPGTAYAAFAELDDPVIEIGLTPNRPDCTGVYGIARDLAAAGLGKLKDGTVPAIEGEGPCPVTVSFAFKGESLCPTFAMRLVRGVKNGPSPLWMQKRLKAIGLRPINTLVDITNYVTFDRGRPLHVFDAAKVTGNLVVREANAGESFLALDGKTYELDESMCVIADERGVESLSGIMGGEESGCDENTTDVLIESALWVPENIASTGRKLGIITDARYRFERGVDPAFNEQGVDLATKLVTELCGGTPTRKHIEGEIPDTDRIITFPVSEVRRLSGLDVSPKEIKATLSLLGFWATGNDETMKVAVPSWRPDVEGKADLVEEVMRIVGVDHVPSTPSLGRDTVITPVLTDLQKRVRAARRVLAGRGLMEAVTWSFIAQDEAEAFGGGADALQLANPISTEMSTMRPSLLPSLLRNVQANVDRSARDVALFEVGQVFAGDAPDDQTMAACGVRRGTAAMAGRGRHWVGDFPAVTAFNAKADALALLDELGLDPATCQIENGAPAWYHPGQSGTIRRGRDVFGHFGALHPRALRTLDVDGPVVAFEITLDALPAPRRRATRTRPPLDLHELMPLRRDFAFVVDWETSADTVLRAAKGADKALVADVSLFDVYAGEHVEPGKKSLAIEVTLQPTDKTLTDADIEAVSSKIVAAVAQKTGATLRG
ncbi:MAG: phenylalanine--tRNA ligase subunit beta, partial [Devosiaceae bacterium]|nr:phenylalanine--tRNA ligase subunit beta [Devosiaceae bacterium MH13]